jgi:hypothetical protein
MMYGPPELCLSSNKTSTLAQGNESAMNLMVQERDFREFSATPVCGVVDPIASSVQKGLVKTSASVYASAACTDQNHRNLL